MSTKRILPHGNARYPWKRWTDGRTHKAVRGQNFVIKPDSFRRTVIQHARRNGLSFETHVHGDTVEFRFFQPDDRPESERTQGKKAS